MNNRIGVAVGLVVTVTACLIGGTLEAQTNKPIGHLKKEDPNELFVFYAQNGECPGNYESVVNAQLAQSRIKKGIGWKYKELLLWVNIKCVDVSELIGYSVSIYFGELIPSESGAERNFIFRAYEPDRYSSFGLGDDEYLRNVVRNYVEIALTDYLKANFDL